MRSSQSFGPSLCGAVTTFCRLLRWPTFSTVAISWSCLGTSGTRFVESSSLAYVSWVVSQASLETCHTGSDHVSTTRCDLDCVRPRHAGHIPALVVGEPASPLEEVIFRKVLVVALCYIQDLFALLTCDENLEHNRVPSG